MTATEPTTFPEPGRAALAAAGELPSDVVKFRLESDYGAAAEVVPLLYRAGASPRRPKVMCVTLGGV